MIKITDACHQIRTLFVNNTFDYNRWETYINSIYDNSAHIFKEEVDAYINTGKYTFEKDFLPVLNAVCNNPKLDVLHDAFSSATISLNQKIAEQFGRELDIEIVLYLGLCIAAGWVTNINGTDTILLGAEKIIELDWCDLNSMYGLIYHELGHVYHAQHGFFKQKSRDSSQNIVWQLFTEGIAMYFEQVLVGDFDYYHQDKNGWKEWCADHLSQILTDFHHDLESMSRFEQRYFGDWCNYHGHSDVGYYLGCTFIHDLIRQYKFDDLIMLPVDTVYELYTDFVQRHMAALTGER